MSDRLPQQVKYFNCIVYCSEREGKKQTNFLKYHGIKNNQLKIANFLQFVKSNFKSAQHVNFYNKETAQYVDRIYLEWKYKTMRFLSLFKKRDTRPRYEVNFSAWVNDHTQQEIEQFAQTLPKGKTVDFTQPIWGHSVNPVLERAGRIGALLVAHFILK